MSRPAPAQALLPSLVDRLTDPTSGGVGGKTGYTLEQMTQAVRRDLEDLLNTRQTTAGIPDVYPLTLASVVGYGLPDFTSSGVNSPEERVLVAKSIETIIARHESRLKNVRVHLRDETSDERTVRFHVEARLAVDPAPEVEFETVLELLSGRTSVELSGGLA